MECIRGRDISHLDGAGLAARAARHDTVHVDLGTGDGRWALNLATDHPSWLVVGIDACRENLRRASQGASRRGPHNALFVIANALDLPSDLTSGLRGSVNSISIALPWGSLLRALIEGDERLRTDLQTLCAPHASLDVYLNAGAVAEEGRELQSSVRSAQRELSGAGFRLGVPQSLGSRELARLPSTWARRLAHGRDPRAVHIGAIYEGQMGVARTVA